MGKSQRKIYIHASADSLKSFPISKPQSKVMFVRVPPQSKVVLIHPDPDSSDKNLLDLTNISSIEYFSNSHDDVAFIGDSTLT